MTVQLLQGDCRAVLPTLDAGSVQAVITSPPYWNLRDYGVAGQLGMEPTRAEYVANLVGVFRQLRRVLRDDAVAFLNLGDCFVGKQLQGIPWRVALALQADGWWLRSDLIWSKPNPMPESVTDRCTRSHEYIFVLAKSATYYWDAEAIKEQQAKGNAGSTFHLGKTGVNGGDRVSTAERIEHAVRNRRSVWTVATQPYAGAHFATFPEKLIEPMVLAGTSPQACETCGAPWARVVERTEPSYYHERKAAHVTGRKAPQHGAYHSMSKGRPDNSGVGYSSAVTTGWAPTCRCETNTGAGRCIILDPFAGSGTTLRVAIAHQRHAIGIDLNPDYAALQLRRTNGVQIRLFTEEAS